MGWLDGKVRISARLEFLTFAFLHSENPLRMQSPRLPSLLHFPGKDVVDEGLIWIHPDGSQFSRLIP